MSEKSKNSPDKLSATFLSDLRELCNSSLSFISSNSFSESNLRSVFEIVNTLVIKSNELSSKDLNLDPAHLASLISICRQASEFSYNFGIKHINEDSFLKYKGFIIEIISALVTTINTIPSDPVFFPRPDNDKKSYDVNPTTQSAEPTKDITSKTPSRFSFNGYDLNWFGNDDGNYTSTAVVDIQLTLRKALWN